MLTLVVGLAGCHLVSSPIRDYYGPGLGRVDQSFPATIRPTLVATLGALDDVGVRPVKMTIQNLSDAPQNQVGLEIEPTPTNAGMLPPGERSDDIFVRHQLKVTGAQPEPFLPFFVTYRGKAADGRTVYVTIATKRGDEADNQVTVRIGSRVDEAWCRAFLAKLAARIEPKSTPTTPVAGTNR